MTENTVEIPMPVVAPLGIEVTPSGVQAVWDTFVKPQQDRGEIQSIEDRTLMAILRAVHAGLDPVGSGWRPAALAALSRPVPDDTDPWCREESCEYRHWTSGDMPTHKRGSTCPAPAPVVPVTEGVDLEAIEVRDKLYAFLTEWFATDDRVQLIAEPKTVPLDLADDLTCLGWVMQAGEPMEGTN